MEFILIFFGAAIINNFVVVQFLGLCPFVGVSKKYSSSIGMGAAVIFVMTLAGIVTYVIYEYLLIPFNVGFLKTIIFILVIASLVQFVEMVIRKVAPALYSALGIYLPLITTNCAILGLALNAVVKYHSILEVSVYSFAAGVGFLFALAILSTIRENLDLVPVPKSFKGAPIAFISAGLIALAFLGFSGLPVK